MYDETYLTRIPLSGAPSPAEVRTLYKLGSKNPMEHLGVTDYFIPRKSHDYSGMIIRPHLAKAHFYPAVTPDKCSFSCDFK